jgi:penicillin-binding protein 1C
MKIGLTNRAGWRLARLSLVLSAAVALAALGWRVALHLVRLPRSLLDPPVASLELLDRHGQPLRQVRDPAGQVSRAVTYAAIPPPLIDATLAAEDKRFWQHPGVDARAIVRATWGLAKHRRVVSGASTVTMQLVKQTQPGVRSFRAKLKQTVLALRLEQVWDKQHILEAYLNRIDYGHLNAGCAQAASFYFAKPLGDLSVAECAFLAGLPQAPTRLDPYRHFEAARRRQQWILGQMRRGGSLAREDFERACQEPLRLARPQRVFEAPHFVDLLRPDLAGRERRVVRTTLDLQLNRFVEQALRQQLSRLEAHHVRNGAAVVIDNRTSELLALVGSEDFFAPQSGQVNGARALRSAGSTLKPFTYLLAFERGATPASVVPDVPVEFATATGVFAPSNYDRHCHGPVRCRLALANSLNIAAVLVLASLGGPGLLCDRLRACGLTTLTNSAEHYGLGLTIGNAEVRLLELANAYACLARLGEFQPCRMVLDAGWQPPGAEEIGQQVFDRGATYLIADILSDNAARAMSFGLESSLRFEFPAACKTGTSSDFRDNWAFGYTPEFTVGVWVGNFDGTPMTRVSGVAGAAPVLHEVLVRLHEQYGTSWYPRPGQVVEKLVHPLTGKLLAPTGPGHESGPGGGVLERFLAQALPPFEEPGDYDAEGRVRLGREYREWFLSSDNWLVGKVALSESAQALRIIVPLPGSTYYLDGDLPENGRRLVLRAEGAGEVCWQSDSLHCRVEAGRTVAVLAEGRHRLLARDPRTGDRLETWIVVKPL